MRVTIVLALLGLVLVAHASDLDSSDSSDSSDWSGSQGSLNSPGRPGSPVWPDYSSSEHASKPNSASGGKGKGQFIFWNEQFKMHNQNWKFSVIFYFKY